MSRFVSGLACAAVCLAVFSMNSSKAVAGGFWGNYGGGCSTTFQSYHAVDYAPYAYNYNPVNYMIPAAPACGSPAVISSGCDTCAPAATCSSHCTSYCPGTFGKHFRGCGFRNGCGYGHGCGLLGPLCPLKRTAYSDCGTCGNFGFSGGCCGW